MNKSKIFGSIIGIILFIVLVAGFAYAWITWRGEDINTSGTSKCFDILYTKGNDISGTMYPASDYSKGLSSTVKVNIDSSCNIAASGKIILNTDNTTSSNLFTSRDGNYPLHYQVLVNGTVNNSLSGIITSNDPVEINIGTLVSAGSATTEYTVYVWASAEDLINSDIGSVYNGSIALEVSQVGD